MKKIKPLIITAGVAVAVVTVYHFWKKYQHSGSAASTAKLFG